MQDRTLSAATRGLLVVLGGGLLLVAFPPVDLWWTAPLGMAALLGTLTGTSPRRSYALSVLAGLVLFLPLLEWNAVDQDPRSEPATRVASSATGC